MDDPLQELEIELKALCPRRPSPELEALVARELSADRPASGAPQRYESATTFRSWKWAGWRVAAAAAAVALVAFAGWRYAAPPQPVGAPVGPAIAAAQPTAETPTVASRDHYRPVGVTNVLYDLRDEGPVSPADTASDRRVSYRFVDTYTWKNPATHASLKWSVPREEVRVIPANYH